MRVRSVLVLLVPLPLPLLIAEEERRLPPLVTPAELLSDELLRLLLKEVADEFVDLDDRLDAEDLNEDEERLLRALYPLAAPLLELT